VPRPGEPMMTMLAVMGLYEDLDWLRDHGALAGVAEILRERRRQIETKGFTPAHDRAAHADGRLVNAVGFQARVCEERVLAGLDGPPEAEQAMARAGALAAAEIDRLTAEFTPEETHARE
jgi:hypothetical protein